MKKADATPDLFAAPAPRLYSIEPGRPFLKDLASALAAGAGSDPLALADMEIFLPTRRAVRALNEAFVAVSPQGRASLLPRIRPLGDIDEDEFALDEPGPETNEIDLPPAVSSLERRLILARMVAAADRAFAGQENWPAALAAAKELSALLDSFYTEEVDFAALDALAPEEHADHWQRSLDFLRIATTLWPEYLAAQGRMDPAERRARLIDLQAERLRRLRPETPVIVAGTTGSAPAVARLMSVVANLPKGGVVLPGLDRDLARDEKAWKATGEEDAHPQAGLKALLERLGISPNAVRSWPGGAPSPRRALLSLALRPADVTDDWLEKVAEATAHDPALANATHGLRLVSAPDEEAEANAIALLLRQALETPGKTAMLVTPDRILARRVAAKMRRWSVTVDDSAGIPFANSPCGTYLRLVAAWMAAPGDPGAALALAKQPLAGFGLGQGARRSAVAALDAALRGLAPRDGAAGLRAKVASHRLAERAEPCIAVLEAAAAFFPSGGKAAFATLLDGLIKAGERIAASDEEAGADRLWRGEDGETGAMLLAEISESAAALGDISVADFAPVFTQMIGGAAVRRRAPAHPRLSILGPLEARLQSADLVILGGLNEGVWPGEAAGDPFLSRPMRREIGLPSPERRIGLAAHDFAQLAAADSAVLTRAERSGGAPAKPSRWLVRLRNILTGANALDAVDMTPDLLAWSAALDEKAPGLRRAEPPRPKPPVALRPRRLSVTRIEKWLRDPYGVYARHILRLEKLEPIGRPFGARELGSLLHKVFEEYARNGGDLADIFMRHAPESGYGPVEAAFYAPGIEASLAWFENFHRERLMLGAPAVIEGEGALTIQIGENAFTITARADRIDLTRDGKAALFDYKSGRPPSEKEIPLFRVQLPLTAMLVAEGGFSALGAREVEGFSYVRVFQRRGAKEDETGAQGAKAAEMIRKTAEGLRLWIAAFDDPDTPYLSQPRAQFVDTYGDYDLLARRREWSIAGGEE